MTRTAVHCKSAAAADGDEASRRPGVAREGESATLLLADDDGCCLLGRIDRDRRP